MKKLFGMCLLMSIALFGQSNVNAGTSNRFKEIIVAKESTMENLKDRVSGNSSNPYYNMYYMDQETILPKFQGGKVLKKIVFFGDGAGRVRLSITHGNDKKISQDLDFIDGKNTLDLNLELFNNVTHFSFSVLTGTLYADKSGVQPELGKIWCKQHRYDNDNNAKSWSLGLGIYLEEKASEDEIIIAKEATIGDLPDKIESNPGNPYFGMKYGEQSLFLSKFQRGKILKDIVFFGATSGKVRVKVKHGNDELKVQDFDFVPGKNTLNLNWQLYDNVTYFDFGIVSGTLYGNKSKIQPELGKINYRWHRWDAEQDQNWSLGLGVYLAESPDKVFEGEIVVAQHTSMDDLPDKIESNSSNPYFNMRYSDPKLYLDKFQGGKKLKRIVFFGASEGIVRVAVVHNDGARITQDFPFAEGKNTFNLDWILAKDVTEFNFGLVSGTLRGNRSKVQPEMGQIEYRWDRWNEGQKQNWSLGLGIFLEDLNYREIVVAKEYEWANLPDIISGNPGNPYFNMWYTEKDTFLDKFQDSKVLRRIVFYGAGPGAIRITCAHGGQTIVKDIDFVDGRNELNLNWALADKVTNFDVAVRSGAIRANKSKAQPELGKIWYRWDRWNEGQVRDWSIGLGIYLEDLVPPVLAEGKTTPIWIHEYQHSQNITGQSKFYHTIIDHDQYTAIRIGEYLWMNKNLSSYLPHLWAEPWNQATDWIGDSSRNGVTQEILDRDMDRLKLDKSQFQIDMEDFHTHYGRYYSRPEIQHFDRKRKGEEYLFNKKNLHVYETRKKFETDWKMPARSDFRQLFAMVTMPDNGVLGQIAVRIALSCKVNENPLAYDIYDPKGGFNYRTSWFEHSTNELGFNMMPGGGRLNGDGPIDNGMGPNNGKWDGKKGDIAHLFHTAKYATADAQVGIHDNISTGISDVSFHWYNVRFCRELTPEELGYKLYINQANYQENYEYTILKLNPANVDIKKIGWNEPAPKGYYELPKGYLRGLYVNHVLDKAKPKSIAQIVGYLKNIDDDLFYAPGRAANVTNRTIVEKQESSVVVYPTLVEQFLNIDTDTDEVIKAVNIYPIAGSKTISVSKNLEGKNMLDVSSLLQGIHVVKVETNKGVFSFKIMKK